MNNRLLGLDALRGLAAIVVVLFHMGLPIGGAHLAVDFFFMLSGFVMARTYEERLTTGQISPFSFMQKRYKRLWGWMAFGTSIGLLAYVLKDGASVELVFSFALMMALVPALNVPAAPYFLNVPLWSIVYELVANLCHALGLARMGKKGLAGFALVCFAGLAWATHTAGFPRGGFVEYHWLTLFKVGASYTMGILIWRLSGDIPPIKVPFSAAFAALPVYCLCVYLWNPPYAPLVFVAVIAPLMMFGGMNAVIPHGASARWASALGDVSFPLYAVHYPIIMLITLPGGGLMVTAIGLLTWAWLCRGSIRSAFGRAQLTSR